MPDFAQQIRDANKERIDALNQAGYVPSLSAPKWKPQLPLSQYDQQSMGIQPPTVGLPPDWNYKTSQLGPNGETMPNGAKGWTPNGDPYFGGSGPIDEWLRGLTSRVQSPSQKPKYGDWINPANDLSAQADEALAQGDLWGLATAASALFTRVGGVIGDVGEFLSGLGIQEGETPAEAVGENPIGAVTAATGRAVGEVFRGGLAVFSQFGEWFEQGRGAFRGAAETVNDPRVMESSIAKWNQADWVKSLIFSINPAGIIADVTRGTGALISRPDAAGKGFSEGWEAGRILYTTFQDPAVKAEFVRRYRAGESAYQLAEELQNPVAELAGELVADPLNFVGWIGKAARTIRATTIARRTLTTIASGLDELADIAKIADDAAASAKIAQELPKIMDVAKGIRTGLSRLKNGFFSLNTTSARNALSERAVFLFKTAAVQYGGKNPDDLLDMVEALARLHGNEASVTKALSIIRKSPVPANILMSQTGFELGYIVRELMTEGGVLKPAEFLSKIKSAKNVDELFKAFEGVDAGGKASRLQKAIDNLIPSLSDDKKLKELGVELGVKGRVFRAAEKVTGTGLYTGARQFYGTLFMGYNPGYTTKAGFTDLLHFAVDDPVAAGNYLVHRVFNRGSEEAWITKEFGHIPDMLTDIPGHAGFKTSGPAYKAATDLQTSMGKSLWYSQAKRNLGKLRDVMFRTISKPIADAGGSEDLIRFLRRTTDDLGDAGSAFEEAIKAADVGYIDALPSLMWMDDVRYGILNDFHYIDRYKAGFVEVTQQFPNDVEALAKYHNEFFNGIEEAARGAAKIPVGIPTEILDEAQAYIAEGAGKGLVARDTDELARIQKSTNFDAEQSWKAATADTMKRVEQTGFDIETVLQKKPELRVALNDSFIVQQGEKFKGWSDAKFAVLNQLKRGDIDVATAWQKINFAGAMPATMTKDRLIRYFYSGFYYPTTRQFFKQVRDLFVDRSHQLLRSLKDADPRLVDDSLVKTAIDDSAKAVVWDDVAIAENGLGAFGSQKNAIYALADLNGVKPIKNVIINTIKKYLPDAEKYTDGALVPFEVAQEAFKARAIAKGEDFIPLGQSIPVMKAPVAADLIPPLSKMQDGAVLPSRMLAEQLDGFKSLRVDLEQSMRRAVGQQIPVEKNPQLVQALRDAGKQARAMDFEAKLISGKAAGAARDFTFLPYVTGKTNFDTLLSVIYPYHFWHTRTYVNWMKRIVSDPGVIAAYAKYKDTMAEIHAGAPEWWKYNINVDELLGLHSDNPIFFNLEASLNPLNGMIGVDFNDPNKRINWWTTALDDMGKWGPSPWPFFQIATALALKMQGENDAAARWAGRLFPQTQTLESLGSLAGLDPFSLDPFTHLFSNGVDPYVASRAGRALGTMVLEGRISEDEAADAASTRSGEWWTEAIRIANAERAPGQLMSFFLGAGFRARSIGDLEADKFDAEYRKLFTLRRGDAISAEQFSTGMNELHDKYPFMDALLLARKDGDERDTALAWSVLRRLPPSGSEIALAAGIPQDLLSKWYDTSGDWASWSETDKDRFMAGVVDMRAILATPDAATRQEWTMVSNMNKEITAQVKSQFGEDIYDKIDHYYQIKSDSQDDARTFLQLHPEVEAALDYKSQLTLSDPLLTAYYGGIEEITRYYKGVMYAEGERRFGADIFSVQNDYYDGVKLSSDQWQRLRAYWKFKHNYEQKELLSKITALAAKLPEMIPASARDVVPESAGQEGVLAELNKSAQGIPIEVIQDALGKDVVALITDYIAYGQPMPAIVQRKIEQIAQQAGITEEALLQLISQSVLSQVQ